MGPADQADPVDPKEETDHRQRPRRRGEQLVAAVVEAVLAELAAHGYVGLTVDAVAARARVSKASLYRRWPGKRELVLAAVQAAVPDPDDLPDTGSLRSDLLAFFRSVAEHLRGPAGPALRGVLGDALGDPGSAAEIYGARHRRRSTEQLRFLLERAVARGEVPAERLALVGTRALEAGPAVVRQHHLWEGEVDDRLCEEVVDQVVLPLLLGSGAGTTGPTPGGAH